MENLLQDSGNKPVRTHRMVERRSMIERRRFSYYAHIPERRSGQDRRAGRIKRKQAAVQS